MSSVVAGWYPVDNEGGECYWDGRNWIENSYQVSTVVDEAEADDAAEAADALEAPALPELEVVAELEVEAVAGLQAQAVAGLQAQAVAGLEVEAVAGLQAEAIAAPIALEPEPLPELHPAPDALPEAEVVAEVVAEVMGEVMGGVMAEPEQRLHLVPEPGPDHGRREVRAPEATREIGATAHEIDAAWLPLQRLPGSVGRRSRLTPHHLLSASTTRRDGSQVSVPTVVDVDVHQSMTQRSRGVFSVRVHIQRPHGIEVVTLDDIPEDREARGTFQESTHRPRHARPEKGTPEPTPLVAGTASADPIEQLRRLGELREAGVVTDSEFAAKKAEVLGRL